MKSPIVNANVMAIDKTYVSIKALLIACLCLFLLMSCSLSNYPGQWQAVDTFEHVNNSELAPAWFVVDAQNDTQPFVENPQVALLKKDANNSTYYVKKAAQDGIVGNRKALSYIALPTPVALGETYTFYTRIMVEAFPNNHSFGLSNLPPIDIDKQSYNAFEPMLRVTDKAESNGLVNTGALMAIRESTNGKAVYADIINPLTNASAMPLQEKTWYQVWYVVNNAALAKGGQRYDIYIQGGEFRQQQKVFAQGEFRMSREKALTHFITISNTGPAKKPYGNGGLAYDDIYMAAGTLLTRPF
jgi:hypothetical protein